MNYDPAVPFEPKQRHPDVEQAIERAGHLHEQLDVVRAERAGAIRDAIEKGASLRELGERLGISPEGVRKMRDADRPSGRPPGAP